MTSEPIPQQWEVWHARFNYEEGKGYKYRPVIVVGIRDDGSLAMMVTSATNKLYLEHDYLLQDWKEAGLIKPSIARVDRIAEIPPNYLGTAGRLGHLSERDIQAIVEIIEGLSGISEK